MKISTKGIYALEVVVDMAMNTSETKLESIKNIASRRNLSEKYLERIVSLLKKEGIVKSTRGAYGGYCLARSAEDIKVSEVLNAVEGDLAPVECLTAKSECKANCDTCATRDIWYRMWQAINGVVDNLSIQDIVNASKTY